MKFWNQRKTWHLGLSLITLICFYNSLENGLVHDDIFAIKENQDLRPEVSISNIFVNDFWGTKLTSQKSHKSYRPLCILTFRINYLFHGIEPYGYHFVNVFLHMAVVNLFFFVLNDVILNDVAAAAFASLIFAIHPIHVEAVTGVVGRADVFSCLLFLLAFHYYSRHLHTIDNWKAVKYVRPTLFTYDFLLTLLYGSMCLFMKEHSVMVFGVCVCFDIIRKIQFFHRNQKQVASNEDLSEFIKRIVFICVWVVTLFLFRLQLMGNQLPPFKHEDNPASFSPYISTRVLTYLYLLAFNLQQLLAPYVLCYDWQVGSIPLVESIFDVRNIYTLVFLAILVLIVFTAFFSQKEDKENESVLLGVVMMVVPFLPASNFFLRVGFVVAERILYIPSLGFCVLVGLGMRRLTTIGKIKPVVYFMFAVLLGLFSVKTVTYNKAWKSRESLFQSGVKTLPHNAKIRYNYANFLSDNNRTDEAIIHYKEATKLYPQHSSAHNNLGILLVDDLEAAEFHYKQAIKYTPGHFRAMYNLATLYDKQDRFEESEEMLRRALSFFPKYFDAQFLLAQLLHKNRKMKDANSMFKMLYDENKQNQNVVIKYAEFLKDIGDNEGSIKLYQRILRTDPNNFSLLLNMGATLAASNQHDKAVKFYERAIALEPTNNFGYQGLAALFYKNNDFNGAKNAYESMMKHCIPSSENLRNYAVVLFMLKKEEEAISQIEDLIRADENYLQAYYTLINFLVERKSEKTMLVIEETLKRFPTDNEVLLQLANLKRNEKLYDEAIEIYKKIIASDSRHFYAHHNLGTVYHIQKKLQEADHYYKLALDINPNDITLKQNVERLNRMLTK